MDNVNKKEFLIAYFTRCLGKGLNEYTLKWIESNYERLGESDEDRSFHIWGKYINSFWVKHCFEEFWHEILPYERIYEIYIDIGFSEEIATKKAKHVKTLMDESEIDKNCMGWSHEPSVYAWLDMLLPPRIKKENYKIETYYLSH